MMEEPDELMSATGENQPSTNEHRLDKIRLVDHDLAAFGIEADIDRDQLLQPLAHLSTFFRIDHQHHKAAATGAKQLAASGTGLTRGIVDFIDLCIGDAAGKLALELP